MGVITNRELLSKNVKEVHIQRHNHVTMQETITLPH